MIFAFWKDRQFKFLFTFLLQ